ncbi:MAG: DUF6311 domain-containing protein [Lachnospiraceae bacterium]|nr:DUF6311 domain-containing protein [Lachnospiraceae bacterium]
MSICKQLEKKNSASFLLGAVIGGVVFLCIFGAQTLDFTYVDWLLHSNDIEGSIDLTQHYLGWEFYRRTPWQFPLGLTEGIYWDKVSVIYTDSIPLFAFVCKLLSPVLPRDFQYFGLFGLLCYALLGGFGGLLIKKLTGSFFASAVASVLFVINPVLLNRMYLHTALSAHFLIVAAFCLWAYQKDLLPGKKIALWSLLLVCGTLINAYFTPMIFGILLASLLQEALEKKGKITLKISVAIIPVLLTVAAAFCFGAFYGDVPASAGGLEVLSFNLNGFFNPFTYLTAFGRHTQGYRDMMYSAILPGMALSTAYQNEGFSYMGLGVLVLGMIDLILLIKERKKVAAKLSRPFVISALVLCVGFTILALSPKCTLGEHVLYELHLPTLLHNMWSAFRSTARFIWVVYYFIIAAFVCLVTVAAEKPSEDDEKTPISWGACFLVAVVVLQLVDLMPGYREKYEAFHSLTPYESPLQSEEWASLGESATQIIFYPDTYYGLYLDGKTSTDFEIYALKHGLSLNNTYMSRNLCTQADERTLSHFARRSNRESFPDVIYIFFDDTDYSSLPASYHLTYQTLDGYLVGTE